MSRRQAVIIVLDSVGIGELPDAASYGDRGADTLGNLARQQGGLELPNLQALGLGNIRAADPLAGCPPAPAPAAAFGRMVETAMGKDTATGHWEFMGLVLDKPFRTFPDGFPAPLIEAFTAAIGVEGVLGNVAASGTVIIEQLGAQHLETGLPIVYTSADPVFQIAAHEDVVPVETLYAWCEAAFEPCLAAGLSRVIARPFVGAPGAFSRTHNRRDFAMAPPRPTILDELAAAGRSTLGVGKIHSIYSGSGVAADVHTRDNAEGIAATLDAQRRREHDLVFTNLVDFDQSYGHRRDPDGYHRCLRAFDARLPELVAALGPDDLLIITADHGNDPTYPGTDHTREYVPLLALRPGQRPGIDLGTRATFADVGQTVAEFLGVPLRNPLGTSFLAALQR